MDEVFSSTGHFKFLPFPDHGTHPTSAMTRRHRFEPCPPAFDAIRLWLLLLVAGSILSSPCAAVPGVETPRERAAALVEEFFKFYMNPNEHVRKAAVMGLEECDHELAVEPLLKAVLDESIAVRKEAEKGLARQTTHQAHHALLRELRDSKDVNLSVAILESFKVSRPKSAYETAIKLTTHKEAAMRVHSAELLGVLEPRGGGSVQALAPLLLDKEADVRIAALASLAQLKADNLAQESLRLLKEDPQWRVRASSIEFLKKLRIKESIQPLIDAMKSEQGRLFDDCHEALKVITAETFLQPSVEDWQSWWNQVKDHFEVPTQKQIEDRKSAQAAADSRYTRTKKEYAPFVGIPTRSQRMLFLLDVSNSMVDRLSIESGDPARLKDFRERYGDYDTKIDLAREELISTIATLGDHVKFNIVTFHTFVEKWKDTLQQANQGNKNAAMKFLTRLTPDYVNGIARQAKENGRTNTFDALNVAFGVGNSQKPQASKMHSVESDTVFLITDGMPTAGRITDPQELIRYVGAANRRAKMVFHVVTFNHGNESLLKTIAEHSGGHYLVISME